jgi:PAS domain S-box-containing protein
MAAEESAMNVFDRLARAEARIAELEAAAKPALHAPQPPSLLLENITDDTVVAINPSRIVTYINPSAERMYGVQSSDAIGKPLSALHGYAWLNPEDEKRCWADLAQHASWKGEYIHIRNDGVHLIVDSTVNLLSEEFGGGMVGVFRDVSARKRAEFEAFARAAQLTRANEDLTHFAYVVSHDLQAPLRTVVSFSQLLSMKYRAHLDEQAAEFIRLIVEAGSRMSAMISDLLELARCAGDDLDLDASVPLVDALSMALDSLRSEVRASSAVITHSDLPVVFGEIGQLAQLFQNLIGNSLKYRKPDMIPRIQLSAERSGNEWVVSVRDNGIGFETQHADQIFGVFKRLHANQYPGTGIGLAICKRIAERRGGKIWATATPGEGAVFSFSVPDEVPGSQPTAAAAQRSPPPPRQLELPPESAATADSTFAAHFDELFQMIDLAHAVVRDMEGKILIWTQGAERLFGWSKKEAIGQPLHTLLRTVFPAPHQQIELELYTQGEWKGQLKKQRKDGSILWVATHWSLYRDGSGRGHSVIEVANDIGALKDAEEALRRSIER